MPPLDARFSTQLKLKRGLPLFNPRRLAVRILPQLIHMLLRTSKAAELYPYFARGRDVKKISSPARRNKARRNTAPGNKDRTLQECSGIETRARSGRSCPLLLTLDPCVWPSRREVRMFVKRTRTHITMLSETNAQGSKNVL